MFHGVFYDRVPAGATHARPLDHVRIVDRAMDLWISRWYASLVTKALRGPAADPREHRDPTLAFLRVLWALDHAMARMSRRMQSTLGVTAEQRFTIRMVGAAPGISAGDLARLLHVDAGTVSATLKRLESRGLVARVRNEEDRRRVGVKLTARGKALDAPRAGTIEAGVERALQTISPPQMAATTKLLERLIDEIDVDRDGADEPRKASLRGSEPRAASASRRTLR